MRPGLFGLAVALAVGGCGAQDWSFDGDAEVDPGDAELRQDAAASDDASDERSVPSADASGDVAAVEAGFDAPSERDGRRSCSVAGDCRDDAPVCSLPSGECLRCGVDGDCAGVDSGPTCDTSSGRCVACTSDLQCSPPTPRCDPMAQACVRCLSNADCGRESFCTLSTHVCTPMI